MGRLLSEIMEQPVVLERFLRQALGPAEQVARHIRARGVRWVLIAARGSSDNAATYAKYVFGLHNALPVALAAPSMYTIYDSPPDVPDALVIGISQSGQSPDVIAVVQDAVTRGLVTLAITNDADSPLAQSAEHVLPLGAGAEESIAATKTYTTQLLAVALLSALLSDDKACLEQLEALPEHVARALDLSGTVRAAAERHAQMTTCAVIARGYNYATALEIALKLRELTYLGASPYSSADFMHGPIAVVELGYPVLLVAPSGRVVASLSSLVQELSSRQAEMIIISDEPELLAWAQTPLRLPEHVPEWLSPITAVIPGQLFAHHLAVARGIDPDRPRGLRKVTRTH